MASIVNRLYDKNLITPPSWLPNNTLFEGQTGSTAYGASSGESDIDVVGFCMPPKENLFPHLAGEIPGFGVQSKLFNEWHKHHIDDKESGKEYDLTIYNIVSWFNLTMNANPNMIDTAFLPRRCVLHSTEIYENVRNNRHLFLSKLIYPKFRGYSLSQMSKINKGANRSNPKRQVDIDVHGYDTKFAYHVARLLLECEQVLATQDLQLDRDSEVYKSIRRGEWTLDRLNKWVEEKERSLETLYANSKLPERPDEEKIKGLLLQCMEQHYGSLSDAVTEQGKTERLVRELEIMVEKYR